MKKLTLLIIILFAAFYSNAQNVAINSDGTAATGSAMLDVKSTTKGFMMPRMSSSLRTSIQDPVLGLLVFDTDTKTIWAYNGSSWSNLTSAGGGSLTLPFDQTVNAAIPAFRIENNGSGDIMQLGSLGNAIGLNIYTTNGKGINVNTTNNIGIISTSWTSNAIHAFTNNPANNIPTIRANNTGGGRGLYANSSIDDGVYGTTNGSSKAGVKGETSATGAYGVFGNHTASNGIGVYGKADMGIGVEAISQSGTGLLAYSGTGYALDLSGKVKIAGGNTNPSAGAVLTSDAQGNATWQQPNAIPNVAFRVSGLIDGQPLLPYNQMTKVQFKIQEYDLGNNYISINENGNFSEANVFYTPINGIYHFDAAVKFAVNDVEYNMVVLTFHVIKNGDDHDVASFFMDDPGAYATLNGGTDLLLNTGDKVYISARQTNFSLGEISMPLEKWEGYTFFSGHLVKKL